VTRTRQKRAEQEILLRYARACSLPAGAYETESPDFVIEKDGRRIGVEITEYHQPAQNGNQFSRTQVEAEWNKLCDAVVVFREARKELDHVSVCLNFVDLRVPGSQEHAKFIQAIADLISQELNKLSRQYITLKIKDHHPDVLRNYLDGITIRVVSVYLEWDWNHNCAGVGTSEQELLELLAPKMKSPRSIDLDEHHLVIAGDSARAGGYIGYLHPNILNGWKDLSEVLEKGPYIVVAILNYDLICIWQKGEGWRAQSVR